MSYITGTITDSNPGPALHALMAPALTEAGFTLVDTVVISTRTHKVWKSAAANNIQGLDWYLDIGYTTTGAGTIAMVAFEFFDPATDFGHRGPYGSSSAVVDAATGTRYGATGFALETNWMSAATVGLQTSVPATTFGYWISITTDRVILMCSPAPTVFMYAGFYQPDPLYAAKAGSAIYPLVTGQINGTTNTGNLGLTRIAPLTTVIWNRHALTAPYATANLPQLPLGPTGAYPFVAGPVQLTGDGPVGGDYARWGWFRDVVVLPAGATVARGDTCTIGGATYVLTTSPGSGCYAFKAV